MSATGAPSGGDLMTVKVIANYLHYIYPLKNKHSQSPCVMRTGYSGREQASEDRNVLSRSKGESGRRAAEFICSPASLEELKQSQYFR